MTPYSAPLPLRQSTVWLGYGTAAPIPQRYGVCGGAPLQYDSLRKVFVWADHAIEGIDAVLVGAQPATGWSWSNGQDTTGHPVAFVSFDSPQDAGADILVRGRGKLHPRTGARIDNPADIVWDVLANIAGNPVDESDLGDFRSACATAGILAGGSIETIDSVIATVRAICASVGAAFAPDDLQLCRIWPGGPVGVSRASIDPRSTSSLTAGATIDDLVNDLTLRFGFEAGQPTGTIRVTAPDSIARFTARTSSIDAPWITSARVAFAIASRLLQASARPNWTVSAAGIDAVIGMGDPVSLAHPLLPAIGAPFATIGRTLDLGAGTTDVQFRVPVGAAPTVVLAGQSYQFAPQQYAGVAVQTQGTDRILTLTNDDGSPIAGAAVTLDGAITHYTDGAGRVSFPASMMPPGEHTLVIVTSDGRTLTTTVLVT